MATESTESESDTDSSESSENESEGNTSEEKSDSPEGTVADMMAEVEGYLEKIDGHQKDMQSVLSKAKRNADELYEIQKYLFANHWTHIRQLFLQTQSGEAVKTVQKQHEDNFKLLNEVLDKLENLASTPKSKKTEQKSIGTATSTTAPDASPEETPCENPCLPESLAGCLDQASRSALMAQLNEVDGLSLDELIDKIYH